MGELTVADVHIAQESVILDRWQAVAEHIQAASFAHVEARRDEVILFEDYPPRSLVYPMSTVLFVMTPSADDARKNTKEEIPQFEWCGPIGVGFPG